MLTRRHLLAATALLPATASAKANPPSPATATDDADFWRAVQGEFTLDRTWINLNNGGCSPSPRVVLEALERYLEWANQAPVTNMWTDEEPGVESVRRQLAAEAGCDPEELAVTRNSSEALQIAQLGLELKPGDEVVTTEQDYPRMLDTWEQRVARDGIVVKKLSFPVPLADPLSFVGIVEAAITGRTRVVHVSHIVNITGQILPVREVCAMAGARGITTIVDGAHAFAHFPYVLRDIGCDFYGVSLHKWCMAPVGTGFLYVRRDRIAGHWPLQPANASKKTDIRKFEEIGTHPAANHDAIAEALVFHQRIGTARKHARLLALRKRWTDAVRGLPRVRIHTPDDPRWSGAIGVFSIDGRAPADITTALATKWRIIATPIDHPAIRGVRVTPSVYTTEAEIDTFVEAVRGLV
jgi:selenocysteine lyase/cysteine desulfurase